MSKFIREATPKRLREQLANASERERRVAAPKARLRGLRSFQIQQEAIACTSSCVSEYLRFYRTKTKAHCISFLTKKPRQSASPAGQYLMQKFSSPKLRLSYPLR